MTEHHDVQRTIGLTPNLTFPLRVERIVFGPAVDGLNAEVFRRKDGQRERMQYEDSTRFSADGICAYIPTEWGIGLYEVQFFRRGTNDEVRRFMVSVHRDPRSPQNVRVTLNTGA